jgi:hypothetical protein
MMHASKCNLFNRFSGYDSVTLNPLGECADGYEGLKCGDCKILIIYDALIFDFR